MNRTAQRVFCIVSAIVLCVMAIAIFSPLHTHQNGKCSLNHFESAAPEGPLAVFELANPLLAPPSAVATPGQPRLREVEDKTSIPARAPPAA